jgi:alpha-tubulin suppressor-like RCC1 family protein
MCNPPPGLSNVVAISAGGHYSLALKSDGTVVAWGSDSANQCKIPEGLSNVIAIAAGGNHNLALKSDGTVVAWGTNLYG